MLSAAACVRPLALLLREFPGSATGGGQNGIEHFVNGPELPSCELGLDDAFVFGGECDGHHAMRVQIPSIIKDVELSRERQLERHFFLGAAIKLGSGR